MSDLRGLIVYSNADRVGALVERDNVWRFAYDPD